ncbi:cation:proton antiporter [Dehalobacter sp. TBBPA1]|uniref:cation:proton antiporter n=1 Tax=Dehalobacter sp. TBBPA1 TaxID=3235037 RepID=UPI0034A24837
MAKEISYLPLLIIAITAVIVPLILNKIKIITIPIVVGEIIAGMILGKSGFNLFDITDNINFLYNLGFLFLMFLAGVEINLDLISSTRHQSSRTYERPAILALTVALITMVLSFGLAFVLKQAGLISNYVIIGLVLSTTSVGVVVPILKERDLLSSAYGQVILLGAMFADIITMVLLSVYITSITSDSISEVFLIILLVPAFFVFWKLGQKAMNFPAVEKLAGKNAQIKIRGAFALLILFILLAQTLKTEIILAAFMAGLIVSLLNDRETSPIYSKLDSIGYGIFTPFFFVVVGMNLNITDIIRKPENIYLLPILLFSVYFVRLIPALILRQSFSWRKALAAEALLSSRLSLVIAISAVGLNYGLIDASLSGTIILLAISSCILSPIIFNQLYKNMS